VTGSDQDVYPPMSTQLEALGIEVRSPYAEANVPKDADLVVGTHGRGFWILDDVTPLRQLDPPALEAPAHLFAPQAAIRFRSNKNTDTPLPPDEPAAPNPPDGAVIAYGMRGNAFRTTDAGRTWKRIDLGAYKGALQGAAELADGTVVLSGADGLVAASRDRGATFTITTLANRALVSAVVEAGRGRQLVAGPGGLRWHDKP